MTSTTEHATEEQVISDFEAADVPIDVPEPWEDWETKLVVWSIGIGIVGLVILGTLVNVFIL